MPREPVRRRRLLRAIGASTTAGTVGLAGCFGGGGGNGDGTDAGDDGDATEADDATEQEADGTGADGTGTDGDGGGGEDTTYKFGVLQSFSGDLAAYGDRWENAQGIAEDILSESGIPNGNDVEFIQGDTQSSPEVGVTAANKLVDQDNVDVLLGAVSSGVSIAIAESVSIPRKDEIFHIISTSSSPKITDLEYVVRSVPSDAFQARALANVAQSEGVESASVITVNNDYGIALAEAFADSYESSGGAVTNQVTYESGKSTYEPNLNAAMEGDPEAIVFIVYPQTFISMARTAFEMGLKEEVQYIGAESTFADPIPENVPAEAINGMVGTIQQAPADHPTWDTFRNRTEEKYGEPSDVFTAFDLDAIMFAALAIEAADGTDPNALREQVRPVSRPPGTKGDFTELATLKEELDAGNDIDYVGAAGSADIDDKGDVPGTYARWSFENGEYQVGNFLDV